ncbi:hypothetical protein U128_03200 [Anaplasma marginale str. Gypsy Plains]|nr:hypothetical protein U128_03200 [Anaplasma marginale str. Gypsy Plains]
MGGIHTPKLGAAPQVFASPTRIPTSTKLPRDESQLHLAIYGDTMVENQ